MMFLRAALVAAAVLQRCSGFGEVRELTDETFDSVVDGSANVLVEFYKPDCGHCQTMEPEFYKTAEALEFESDVILARVDTEESPKIGKRFAIDGHPIFRWFAKGTTTDDKFYFVHYSGRMANTFLKMIGERTGSEYPPLEIEVSKVRKIKAEEFDDVVLDDAKHTFCVMYTPWTESKFVVEALDGAAKIAHMAGANVDVIKMGIDRVFERDIADKYACKGYPCYFLFKAGEPKDAAPVRYNGPDDEVEKIVEFVNEQTGLALDPLGTTRKVEIGRVAKLDALLADPDRLDKIDATAKYLPADQKTYGEYYVKVAKKVAAGDEPAYVADELARITNLLKNTQLSSGKRKEITARKNILNAFAVAATAQQAHGGEL